jgi:hypothetical protein
MEITQIAKSQTKESYSDDNSFWYKEFAIGKLDKEVERDEFVSKYGARELWTFSVPCVSMSRRVDIIDGKTSYRDWTYYWFCDGMFKAALSIVGDTGFENATSLNPVYDQAKEHAEKERNLRKELKELEDKITPYKYQRTSNLVAEYADRFTQELKDKKLYKKAMNNVAPVEIVNEIKSRLQGEYTAELNRINTRVDEIKAELEELK